ncbi:MAG: hypothetical protein NVS1B11_36480 [Terriglobales bacterium]
MLTLAASAVPGTSNGNTDPNNKAQDKAIKLMRLEETNVDLNLAATILLHPSPDKK